MAIPHTTMPTASGSGMNGMPATVDTITPFVVTYQLGMNVFHSNRRRKNRAKNTATCTHSRPSMAKNTACAAAHAAGNSCA